MLLRAGAAVNLSDSEGRTALMLAASQLDDGFFIPLLNAGADATLKAHNGWTALLFACAASGGEPTRQSEVVEKLIDSSECRGIKRRPRCNQGQFNSVGCGFAAVANCSERYRQ